MQRISLQKQHKSRAAVLYFLDQNTGIVYLRDESSGTAVYNPIGATGTSFVPPTPTPPTTCATSAPLPQGDGSTVSQTKVTWDSLTAAGANQVVTATASTDLVNATAHGYAVGQAVQFSALTGGAGLAINTTYYIIASGFTVNAFKLSLTQGGAAIDITTNATAATIASVAQTTARAVRLKVTVP